MDQLDERATTRRRSRILGAVLGALLLTTVFAVANPASAGASNGGVESQFVSAINAIRAAHGAQPLRIYGELTGIARNWSDQMVANGGISHNPDYTNEVSAYWTKL